MAFPITRTVLVVDDDETFRVALQELLEQRGIVVRDANDAATAIREIDGGNLDVIFTDIRMPGGGFGVLQRVRERGMHIPVIFITGAASPEWRARADAEGAFAYLTKPVGREDILAVLQRAFERGRGPADILARHAMAARHAQAAQRG
ncbi:MAG TPA: response regulator [Candidatus Binatia bacterium]|jgi:CheY-like chemotaxis protein